MSTEQPKPYEPSEEEIKKAEEMMTEEQKSQSKEREKEILEATAERTLSNAKLIEDGAKYVMDRNAKEPRLKLTRYQVSHLAGEPRREQKEEKIAEERAEIEERKWEQFELTEHLRKELNLLKIEVKQQKVGGANVGNEDWWRETKIRIILKNGTQRDGYGGIVCSDHHAYEFTGKEELGKGMVAVEDIVSIDAVDHGVSIL